MAILESELETVTSWVEERNGYIGFILYPRELSITKSDDQTNWLWHWLLLESQGHMVVELAKLLQASELEIRGKFEMSRLSAKAKYEVAFMVMLKEPIEGWESPVTLKLDLPDGTSQSHELILDQVPKNQWVMLVIGDFVASGAGDVKFSMVETTKRNSKKGLIIKSAVIRPAFD